MIDLIALLKKIDLKIVLILIFLILFGVFFTKWYFEGGKNKAALDLLHQQNTEIISEKKQIAHSLDSLQQVNKLLLSDKSTIESELENTNIALSKYVQITNLTTAQLNRLKSSLDQNQKSIDNLQAHPVIRVDGDLLNSLSKKYNQ